MNSSPVDAYPCLQSLWPICFHSECAYRRQVGGLLFFFGFSIDHQALFILCRLPSFRPQFGVGQYATLVITIMSGFSYCFKVFHIIDALLIPFMCTCGFSLHERLILEQVRKFRLSHSFCSFWNLFGFFSYLWISSFDEGFLDGESFSYITKGEMGLFSARRFSSLIMGRVKYSWLVVSFAGQELDFVCFRHLECGCNIWFSTWSSR